MYGAIATASIFLACLLISIVGLLFARHPAIGYSDNIVTDAEAVATGHLQYGNPATEYSGFPYTPLFTWLLAGLLRVFWWVGWGPLLSMVAALTAITAIVRLLWTASSTRTHRVIASSFVIALSLGGLSALVKPGVGSFNTLAEARPDQLATCFLIVAAVVVFRGLLSTGLTRKQMIVTGLLMTASVGTKQTTLVPCLVLAVIVLVVPRLLDRQARPGPGYWLRYGSTLLTFVGSSALLGIAMQMVSHGYAFDVVVKSQLRYGDNTQVWRQVGGSLRLLTVPLVALVVLATAAFLSLRASRDEFKRRDQIVSAAVVALAISPIPTAILAEAKLGGEPNQLVVPVWTLTLGCTVLLLALRPSVRRTAMSAVACGVLLCAIDPFSQAFPNGIGVPNLHIEGVVWSSMDPFLLGASERGKVVYDETYPSLSVTPSDSAHPAPDINDALAEGYVPRWFINNLLTGRYAYVSSFQEWLAGYDSDLGRYDTSVPWKIDLLLQRGYRVVKDPYSTEVKVYRPTPRLKELGWLGRCFGPYQARGADIDVRLRGFAGLACIQQGRLSLKKSIWTTTNLFMTFDSNAGAIALSFPRAPQGLRITPFDDQEMPIGPVSKAMGQAHSAVGECLVHSGNRWTVTLRAAKTVHTLRCHLDQQGAVLQLPFAPHASKADVNIHLSMDDSAAIVALSRRGLPAPFVLLNPTPSTVGGP